MTKPDLLTEFHVTRAQCVDRYAKLEYLLLNIFSWLIDDNPVKSHVVFTKVINAQSRNSMMQELLELQFPGEEATFRNALFLRIANIDRTRNYIVHWHLHYRTEKGITSEPPDLPYEPFLKHPNIADGGEQRIGDLREFLRRVNYVVKVITIYQTAIIERIKDNERSIDAIRDSGAMTLQEISQLTVPYPPTEDHPLFRFL